ncbi:ribosome small subunit-dependent GTPase A [Vibrio panuliri]|uniref:Small ribosomal subunit biogenesis GTPase RsgA n=1 Tax=Vibrio panuliri TaxID=1381081 RepID=A0A1Q9HR04_9VIBR|nr:ribosome small subunit-dependent GTPase A [Vibrio panuliri]KAB1458158.1 ribosome small subunit-dependent GTPase A [Vibrio panuliri]OLQ93273.1 ribosome small subunit-dependent GTPase A [Vibrio panuliri]
MSSNANSTLTLNQLGWNNLFHQQLTLDDLEHHQLARISEHHRSGYTLLTESGSANIAAHKALPDMTVGDWVVLDAQSQFIRLLERQSLFSRKAAGSKVSEQLIAANVNTLFIVCSLNDDFNLSRIERYLSIAHDADVEPVIVLTKADLCTDIDEKRAQVQSLDPMLFVEVVNALDPEQCQQLTAWCKQGKTVAFMGSSGVGKSTLVNSLLGEETQETGGIREHDSKGRHTTTSRSLHLLPSGGVLIDTPGMRELQIHDCADGVEQTFSDVQALVERCRFSDCQHNNEPGCAVTKALDAGEIDERRVNNYFKLMREQEWNGSTLAEQRSKSKQFAKYCRTVQSESRSRKQGY